MKKADIQSGTLYTNGKGRFRLVTAVGPQFLLYPSQEETDCVQYVAVRKSRTGLVFEHGGYNKEGFMSHRRGSASYHNITRASFASWAKHITIHPDDHAEVMQVIHKHIGQHE